MGCCSGLSGDLGAHRNFTLSGIGFAYIGIYRPIFNIGQYRYANTAIVTWKELDLCHIPFHEKWADSCRKMVWNCPYNFLLTGRPKLKLDISVNTSALIDQFQHTPQCSKLIATLQIGVIFPGSQVSYRPVSKKFLTHVLKHVYNFVGVLFQLLGQLEFLPTGRFLMKYI